MEKKTTTNALGEMLAHVVKHMATKEDIERIDGNLVRIQDQVSSIETQIRGMKYAHLETRVLDLEEEVFGKVRK